MPDPFAPVSTPGFLAGRGVLIIVENLPVPFDRRVWQEALALRDGGAEVSVICPAGDGAPAGEHLVEGIHIHRHPLPPDARGAAGYLREYAAALWQQSRLAWRIWRRRRFDVIHGCNPPDLIFLVALQFRLAGCRFVFDHHDISPELFEAKFGKRGVLWWLLRGVERLTFAVADVSIATNESYRKIACGRGAMAPERVFVVRSGPDQGRLRRVPANPRWKSGRRFLVGYVGVMGAQEGIDLLLRSAEILCRERGRRDLQFVLVGGGPELEALRALSRRMGLEDVVSFPGRLPDADLFEMLSTADICVNPDRVTPMNDLSTMNKILEYMVFAKPIVQFDVTEGRVSAGPASLYARANDPEDFADRIEALLADPEMRHVMGQAGLKRLREGLCWPQQVPALHAAYRRVLGL
ncbi:glycosyltransferase WbuB [Brevirhabdus pacifica]|uniref:Glycosyltransferase WbuB n=1 Tax=Brevirhabdus pacifica TaxID=1267768 RepID=A0A1U7DLQ5_9RHOB|nr:glycosyltransferase WbuB [Brevirhabdus pacifica]